MITDMTLTEIQKNKLEQKISDHIGEEVEVSHCQNEGDCYKAFYSYEKRDGRIGCNSIYFSAWFHNNSDGVTDFQEMEF